MAGFGVQPRVRIARAAQGACGPDWADLFKAPVARYSPSSSAADLRQAISLTHDLNEGRR